MSRVGVRTPSNITDMGNLIIETTNPDIGHKEFSNTVTAKWGEIESVVQSKTGKFFKLNTFSRNKTTVPSALIGFTVYKNTITDYQVIIDALQELLPHFGIRLCAEEDIEAERQ